MSEKIAKELNEKGIGKIEDDALRVLLTDTVIYKNAQELQDEFYTIYIASGPAISTSHIIHTTLEPLYEEYQVPVHPDKEFWNGLFNAFNAGISVGMDFATMEMIADASYVNTNKNPWGKDVFTRGQIVDDALGNNLGRTFPRIDIWNKADDAIYSIKSYDTATSYQKASSWYKQLKCDINTLIDVTIDISYRGTTVAVSASTSKGLIIALPNKALTWSQRLDLLDAFTYAADNGIKLIIKVVK